MASLNAYLVVSALLFLVGLLGALTRRNAIVILMCVELMLNAVNLTLVAFNTFGAGTQADGQAFAILVFAVAAAEAGVGIALILSVYRHLQDADVTQMDLLRW